MVQLRIALAQVNVTVGDLDGNADRIVSFCRRAAKADADLVAFGEMALTGYPVEDLALRGSFVSASRAAIRDTAARLDGAGLGDLPVVVGYLDRCAEAVPRVGMPAGAPQDAVAVLHGGRLVARSAKHHLPNYGVFDEYRYFVPGDRLPVVRVRGVDVAIAVCEDLWQDGGPVTVARRARCGLLLTLNASPYERDKDDHRRALAARRAREAGAALAYVNLVGGQDELVHDGDSLIVDADGTELARAPQFREDLLIADLELPAAGAAAAPGPYDAEDGTRITVDHVDLGSPTPPRARGNGAGPSPVIAPRLDDPAEVYSALVLGTRDYAVKNGFASAILGLSGGIDSALTATIAADALGAGNVHVLLMPSTYSSSHSVSDAEDLVVRQGLRSRTVPIAAMMSAFQAELGLDGVAEENLQARIRGMIVMSLSNDEGHLVLATGNKSELATGYSTLYGDAVGGFAPIKDVPKTMVWALARWRNARAGTAGGKPPIPENSISKPPSAELRPGQLDTDSLPDYELLDALLDDYVEKDMGRDALIDAGHEPALVTRVITLVDRAEYKRRQYPPGPKITPKSFGRDRRLPITNRWRESPS